MGEGITISDRGNGETVIEVREALWQLFESIPEILTFFLIFLLPTFFFLPIAFVVSTIILFLLIPKLFCRKVIIAFTPNGEKHCEISTKSYFQIGYLKFMFANQSGTCAYGAIAFYETKGRGKSTTFIITIPCADSKKIRIWITYYPETLTKIINKILLLKKSESVAKSEVREDAVLNAENDYSTSIIDLLSMINPASCGIVRKNNHLIFDNKRSHTFSTFWHILGGTLLISLGLWILAGISKSLGILIPPEPELSIGSSIGYSLVLICFTLATALVFRGVYIIVKRLITAVLYQMVWFDNISQVITLEEQFPIYKSTQKYFWEKAELLIEKSQNDEDYLKDKKVLVLTLQNAGQPARRVELFKHQNEEYIQQLRDYILEFHREQDTDISDTIR